MKSVKVVLILIAAALLPAPWLFAASHREAPITALDRAADITDWYTFVSYPNPGRVTMILDVDPFLEPSNGPNYFPFDSSIQYAMHVDNNNDGLADDIVFLFRFRTEDRSLAKGLFTSAVGGVAGIPPITSLDGPGSVGLAIRQTYTVTMVKNGVSTDLSAGRTLFAVPSNVGPRTMPNYTALYNQGIYSLTGGIRVFAATVNDPFYIDLGAAFDSLKFRAQAGGGVLTAARDADNTHNYAPDAVAGYNVNSIVLEVPITLLTVDGKLHPSGDKRAVIGTYGTTARSSVTLRDSPDPIQNFGQFQQIQRMGNPLINELIIGNRFKDRFSMDGPENDKQFSSFFLHPLLADVFASIGIPVPTGPRTDLLPLVQYMAPICPGCGPNDKGAIADLLRLNTGIAPTAVAKQKRLAFLTALYGDPNPDLAGFPNGRRPIDDVTDIASRAVAGILKDPKMFGTRIGDGVNTDGDNLGFRTTFPFVLPSLSGRDSHHVGPSQKGCTGFPPNNICPVN